MKRIVVFSVGLLLLAGGTALAATDYEDGVAMGRVQLQREFQSRGNDCARLTDAVTAAHAACSSYPNAEYGTGCKDGVKGYYETVQWTICRPSGDQCEKIGSDAADLLAARTCNVAKESSSQKVDPNRQACFDAALPQCESSVRTKLNVLVSSGSCWIDAERTQLRTQPYEIYDAEYLAIRSECDGTLRGILGLPLDQLDAGADTAADVTPPPADAQPDAGPPPDGFSGLFNISEGLAAKPGTIYPGYPQWLTISACDKRCGALADCYGWTYEKSTGRCFPQTIQSSGKYESRSGYTSGVRKVGFSGVFVVFDLGYLRAGNDLPGYPRKTDVFQCDQECASRVDCWGWTWTRQNGTCWLKNWNGRGGAINGHASFVSGVRP